ncbi:MULTISPECIES: prolyl oligopeptidase family serine peptidase [Deefgea]|uniref:Prolyl oligopeptidase family serine peptidase n=1 Tax=Deefgea chitinilytica TaxID=570276 RepID=A0ABS2C9C5_9NEIS|nr:MULTISPECIES: prolyl oligopeptidase family serine peptidase [Deefgea]MBM5570754.1 prolyl oligopeptidase family serine peptidase [Deefgea chitinilytica]MBM9887983.1 S9 family peptidase [Deefgea sp. CFH1-16]
MQDTPLDSFLFLENYQQATKWIAKHNQHCRIALERDPRFDRMRIAIANYAQNNQQIPYFAQYGEWLYHFFQSESQPRGVYRRTTYESYCSAETEWFVVFDLDALALQEEVDWYLAGISHCILAPERCLISLNISGSDASVCREFDVETQRFVNDSFQFPLGKNQIHWRDYDSVFVCPAWDESQLSQAGYSCEVWLLQRGQTWEEAFSIAVLPETILKTLAWRFLDGPSAHLDIVEVALSFYKKVYYCVDAQLALQQIKLPLRCDVYAFTHGDLIIKLGMDWRYQESQYQAGSLLAIECNPQTAQLGRIQTLIAPTPTQTIQGVDATKSGLVVHVLDNVKSQIQTFVWQAKQWNQIANAMPTTGAIEFVDQPWATETLYYNYSDFLQPAALYRYDLLSAAPPELLRQQIAAFAGGDYEYQQYFATSKDGTAVPYFVVCAKELELNAQAPTLLYGYGGFQVSMLPYYVDNLGPHWLAKGGVFVVANIRGGGEFGPKWHQAVQGIHRQRSFDDFIAVAEDLIARGVTSPLRLGIQGGSHGGLLVGACLTQRPDLFNAVVCEVPLLDMLRYTLLHAGASWMDEYGDPNQNEARAALAAYSPYHQIKPATEQRYPKILLTSNRQDDRVHPAHARKMAAKLAELGHEVLFYENDKGGHRGNVGVSEMATDLARVLTFLHQQLMD